MEAEQLSDITELERSLPRQATVLIEACLRHSPEQHAVVKALAALKMRDAPAVIGGGGKLKLIITWRSETAYVWAYGMLAIPGSKHAVILLGRQWLNDLSNGRLIRIPSELSGETFVDSYAGGRLFLPCQTSPYFWESAIVTDLESTSDDLRPPRMWGYINAFDMETRGDVRLEVGKFEFDGSADAESVEPDIDYLPDDDVETLRIAIKRYNAAPSGVFRPDRIKLSGPGRRLINCFLFLHFRAEYAKSSTVNFLALLKEKPKIEVEFSIRTTDHYIARSEKWTENNKGDLYFTYVLVYNYHELLARPISGAGLEQQLKHLVDLHGFQHVADVLFGIAPPEKRALAMGMVSAEYPQAASSLTAKPTLSDVDRAAFLEASATNPWSAKGGLAPSKFMQEYFGQWFDQGLGLADIRFAQPKLAAAYSVEVSRDPSRRLTGLYVKPHTMPSGAPPSPSKRRAADLTREELEKRRAIKNKRQKSYRAQKNLEIRIAPPEQRALAPGMVSAEYPQAASSLTAKPTLSDVDRAAFLEASTTNQWSATGGLAPSKFMQEHFGQWFDRGLAIDDISAEQPSLVADYKNEILHNPRKRIRALTRAHKLPAGTQKSPAYKLVAELSEAELATVREQRTIAKRASRKRKAAARSPEG